jgi:hypothetical protein
VGIISITSLGESRYLVRFDGAVYAPETAGYGVHWGEVEVTADQLQRWATGNGPKYVQCRAGWENPAMWSLDTTLSRSQDLARDVLALV